MAVKWPKAEGRRAVFHGRVKIQAKQFEGRIE